MNLVLGLLIIALWLYFILLIGRLILDYVQMFARSWRPHGPVLVLAEIIYTATDPPLRALRKIIPPLRLGSISLDLSFLVLLILIQVMISILESVSGVNVTYRRGCARMARKRRHSSTARHRRHSRPGRPTRDQPSLGVPAPRETARR